MAALTDDEDDIIEVLPDEDIYEVERILAEKVTVVGELKYLVKWENYMDEECTWEPAGNFTDQQTILTQWQRLKAAGDTLDEFEVQAIQRRMDEFASRNNNETTSQYSDVEDERPAKRQRLVPDAPLVTKKKGVARPSGRNQSPIKPRASTYSSSEEPMTVPKRVEKAAPPLFAASAKAKIITSTRPAISIPESQSKSGAEAPRRPAAFHAPELVSRKKTISGEPRTRKVAQGTMFRSASHMNNARKKAAVIRSPPQPPPSRSVESAVVDNTVSTPNTFSLDQQLTSVPIVSQAPRDTPTVQVQDQSGNGTATDRVISMFFPEDEADAKPTREQLESAAASPTSLHSRRISVHAPLLADKVDAGTDESEAHALNPITLPLLETLNTTCQTLPEPSTENEPSAVSTPKRPRRNSLFGNKLPPLADIIEQSKNASKYPGVESGPSAATETKVPKKSVSAPFTPIVVKRPLPGKLDPSHKTDIPLHNAASSLPQNLKATDEIKGSEPEARAEVVHKHRVYSQRVKFPGLNATLQQLTSYRLVNDNDKIGRNKSNFLICHHSANACQPIKDWLINQGQPRDRVYVKAVSGHYDNFRSKLKTEVCVMLFDIRFPLWDLVELAYGIVSYANLICWQFELEATTAMPISVERVFGTGIALTISETCFVEEPKETLAILTFFWEKHVNIPYCSARIIFPPNIQQVVLDQAGIVTQEDTMKLFISLAKILDSFEEMSLEQPTLDFDGGGDRRFSAIRFRWQETYKETAKPIPERVLAQFEQREENRMKEEALYKYFASWALSHVRDHRMFIAVMNGQSRPRHCEHVRWLTTKRFHEILMQTNT